MKEFDYFIVDSKFALMSYMLLMQMLFEGGPQQSLNNSPKL
jgi:hypothetical protein